MQKYKLFMSILKLYRNIMRMNVRKVVYVINTIYQLEWSILFYQN